MSAARAEAADAARATRLAAAYDPARFRADGEAVVALLAEALASAQRRQGAVLPWAAPEAAARAWAHDFAQPDAGGARELLARVVAGSHHLHHPRYVGHQVTAPLPLAALCDLVSAYLNNGMAVYEMGPVATAMERAVIEWMAARIGFAVNPGGPGGAGGVLTSGGSAGNLTALLAARQAGAGFDVWQRGLTTGQPLAVLAAETTHYSVARAAEIMGLGAEGVFPVPVDAAFQLRAEALPAALATAERAGRRVIAVVASAGSTATGAIDPLPAIADFAEAHRLWLHVDAAHGGSALTSAHERARLRGIERADSVVWDAHKMMLVPSLVTGVIFRDAARGHAAFAQQADYLFRDSSDELPPWWDVGLRTLECTKLMMALKVYVALRVHGEAFFGDYVDHVFALARRFAARLSAAPDFELALAPAQNIVCFRHTPAGVAAADLDALQARVRDRVIQAGQAYLVKTGLPAGVFLRTTIINPLTTDADLDAVLDAVRAAARPAPQAPPA
ncbi:MAG: aminotransferase class I/II-fold pyridoxal phosphate-dependent enzyme [Deltaproteobacteria bacterium]|nr:aminotransferase class I/II-fold pyridoxal phosphate-dependent enzyme [Deltaproteobacteria bacterium]